MTSALSTLALAVLAFAAGPLEDARADWLARSERVEVALERLAGSLATAADALREDPEQRALDALLDAAAATGLAPLVLDALAPTGGLARARAAAERPFGDARGFELAFEGASLDALLEATELARRVELLAATAPRSSLREIGGALEHVYAAPGSLAEARERCVAAWDARVLADARRAGAAERALVAAARPGSEPAELVELPAPPALEARVLRAGSGALHLFDGEPGEERVLVFDGGLADLRDRARVLAPAGGRARAADVVAASAPVPALALLARRRAALRAPAGLAALCAAELGLAPPAGTGVGADRDALVAATLRGDERLARYADALAAHVVVDVRLAGVASPRAAHLWAESPRGRVDLAPRGGRFTAAVPVEPGEPTLIVIGGTLDGAPLRQRLALAPPAPALLVERLPAEPQPPPAEPLPAPDPRRLRRALGDGGGA